VPAPGGADRLQDVTRHSDVAHTQRAAVFPITGRMVGKALSRLTQAFLEAVPSWRATRAGGACGIVAVGAEANHVPTSSRRAMRRPLNVMKVPLGVP
jgi:hypothetical protein